MFGDDPGVLTDHDAVGIVALAIGYIVVWVVKGFR